MASEKTEKVVAAAATVFLRHGYKKVTMSDLAEAANLSRPALYLVFQSKEAIFRAVLLQYFETAMAEVHAGMLPTLRVEQQLLYAFDIWCIRPFAMTLATPDTKDLLGSGYTYAEDIVARYFDAFETLLAKRMEPAIRSPGTSAISAKAVAHMLVNAAIGFKQVCDTTAALRDMIALLVSLTLRGLDADMASDARG
jgi:AcrR family transcriptional regulator